MIKTTRRLSPQSGIVSSRRPMSATLQPSRIRHQRFGAAFPRRDRSTKSAASSASLRSVLRGVPRCARMVRPRAKSVTWIARTATGKSGGMSPAQIPSRKRRFHQRRAARDRALQEPPNLSVVHKRRDARSEGSPGRTLSRSHFRRRTSESPRSSREDSVARGVPSRLMRPSVLRTP